MKVTTIMKILELNDFEIVNMKTISYAQIMSFNPCYDPQKIGMPTNYEDTIVNFISEYRRKVRRLGNIKWVLLRKEFLSDKQLMLYAIWCARQVQHLIKDQRSIRALDVAEAYVNNNATIEELGEAKIAADAAADAAYADAAKTAILNKQIDKLIEIFEGETA